MLIIYWSETISIQSMPQHCYAIHNAVMQHINIISTASCSNTYLITWTTKQSGYDFKCKENYKKVQFCFHPESNVPPYNSLLSGVPIKTVNAREMLTFMVHEQSTDEQTMQSLFWNEKKKKKDFMFFLWMFRVADCQLRMFFEHGS